MPPFREVAPGVSSPGGFDFAPRTRIVFGPGALSRLAELAAECGGRRVLMVTDRGIVAAGHVDRAEQILREACLAVERFDGVEENPTEAVVESCRESARRHAAELLVGLGGGSSIDTAKGCNFLLGGGGRMEDYRGHGKARGTMLPLIAIPTTAGTGSECQSYALISQEGTHAKMACGDPRAAPRVALLDPQLTRSQPRRVAAATGIDALAHAVETAVTRKRNPLTEMFSREAFRRLVVALPRVLVSSADDAARGEMLLGAALAGLAIEHGMLGAAHAAANPLTARLGVVHGQAVGMILPSVVRFNARDPAAARIYAAFARDAGVASPCDSPGQGAERLAAHLESLLAEAGMARTLAELGVTAFAPARLAEEAASQWTAGFNPLPLTAEDFTALYRSIAGPAEARQRTAIPSPQERLP